MKKTEVIDLLNMFNGPWYVYAPVLNEHGEEIDQVCVASHESRPSITEKVMRLTVRDFTGCIGFGINIYVNDEVTIGGWKRAVFEHEENAVNALLELEGIGVENWLFRHGCDNCWCVSWHPRNQDQYKAALKIITDHIDY